MGDSPVQHCGKRRSVAALQDHSHRPELLARCKCQPVFVSGWCTAVAVRGELHRQVLFLVRPTKAKQVSSVDPFGRFEQDMLWERTQGCCCSRVFWCPEYLLRERSPHACEVLRPADCCSLLFLWGRVGVIETVLFLRICTLARPTEQSRPPLEFDAIRVLFPSRDAKLSLTASARLWTNKLASSEGFLDEEYSANRRAVTMRMTSFEIVPDNEVFTV